MDLEVWFLCAGENGVPIRNPNEILDGWTYEQVWEARELADSRQQIQDYHKKIADMRRQSAKTPPRRRR